MSRFTGPRVRVLRALDADLPGLSRKSKEKRPQRPGQHGGGRWRRPSEYALQLLEKQKLRFNYGLHERQLRRVYREATRLSGVTGDVILGLLERRLDNICFRLGIATTIPAARQIVNHGHVYVNGRRCDVASARLRRGDVITLSDKAREFAAVKDSLDSPRYPIPAWLSWDDKKARATVVALPTVEDVLLEVDMQLIVEFYAR